SGSINTNSYNMTINGSLRGSGYFNKSGAGTLILANSASFPGVTTISQGTLELASPTALQYSTVSVNVDNGLQFSPAIAGPSNIGGITGPGSMTLTGTVAVGGNNADTTYSGTISGTGTLVKSGTGSIDLTGSNTWTGGTI